MFLLQHSSQVPGVKGSIPAGYPDPNYATTDLVIVNSSNIYSFIELNSNMLREALLADPLFTCNVLGLIVSDKEAKKGKGKK